MPKPTAFPILPYSLIVGQAPVKLALELAYICPAVGGVLLSGHRGTAKSTAVRAIAKAVYGKLPVTLPINATDDRVIGGWKIADLMRNKTTPQPGLLEEAKRRLLYIDEVNLLDDHLVNLILDVASTGVLEVQRENRRSRKAVSFILVGTMNPEEGGLRPQLLDRFGLMVEVEGAQTEEERLAVLKRILEFDDALAELRKNGKAALLERAYAEDQRRARLLSQARDRAARVRLDEVLRACAGLAEKFNAEGHRAEHAMAQAARAHAALRWAEAEAAGKTDDGKATIEDVKKVARLALQHRRRSDDSGRDPLRWDKADDQAIANFKPNA
jgi:magnesium chelatase subunit I